MHSVGIGARKRTKPKKWKCAAAAQRDQIVIIIISFIGNKQKRVVRKITNFDFCVRTYFSFLSYYTAFKWVGLHTRDPRQRQTDHLIESKNWNAHTACRKREYLSNNKKRMTPKCQNIWIDFARFNKLLSNQSITDIVGICGSVSRRAATEIVARETKVTVAATAAAATLVTIIHYIVDIGYVFSTPLPSPAPHIRPLSSPPTSNLNFAEVLTGHAIRLKVFISCSVNAAAHRAFSFVNFSNGFFSFFQRLP